MSDCQHRKVRVRGKGGKFHVECLGCSLTGQEYESPTEAFLARKSDLADARALSVANAQKVREAMRT